MNVMRLLGAAAALAALVSGQSRIAPRANSQGSQRMEIALERHDSGNWRTIDPNLVLADGDSVRFRLHTNFDGYLYVMNLSSSGKYEQLFPRADTGEANHIAANHEYLVPATSSAFRISGPPGFETVYWLLMPARVTNGAPHFDAPPPDLTTKPLTLLPRCDDTVLRARGDCIDHSAGLKLAPRGEALPPNLASTAPPTSQRDLTFMRQHDSTVVSSDAPLTGPVIYEFRIAHK